MDPERVGYPYLPALRRIARELAVIGQFADAEAYARRALAIGDLRDDPWSLAEGNLALGLVYLESGRTAERAVPVLIRALECARAAELGLLEPHIVPRSSAPLMSDASVAVRITEAGVFHCVRSMPAT